MYTQIISGHGKPRNERRKPDSGDNPVSTQRRDEERRAALDRLSRTAMETGLYDRNEFPDDGQDD